jgi:hypothetical protein
MVPSCIAAVSSYYRKRAGFMAAQKLKRSPPFFSTARNPNVVLTALACLHLAQGVVGFDVTPSGDFIMTYDIFGKMIIWKNGANVSTGMGHTAKAKAGSGGATAVKEAEDAKLIEAEFGGG